MQFVPIGSIPLFLIAVTIVGGTTLHLTSAEHVIRVVFNEGISLPNGNICSSSDNTMIDHHLAFHEKRQLRTKVDTATTTFPRTLQRTYSTKCKSNCAGYKTGYCRFVGCNGYRRMLEEFATHDDKERRTSVIDGNDSRNTASLAHVCPEYIKHADTVLNELVNLVSQPCQAILKSPRNITCYDDTIFGEVENVMLWGEGGNIKEKNFHNGYTICRDTAINIEAVVNGCVDTVHMSLYHSSGTVLERIEYSPPYTLFSWFPSIKTPYPFTKRLSINNYTLSIISDGIKEKPKKIHFSVTRC